MEITIDRIINIDAKRVLFSNEFGSNEGIWKGTYLPEINRKYCIEIDFDNILKWGESIKKSKLRYPRIWIDTHGNNICGELESVEEDMVATIRIGNSIFLVETKGTHEEPNTYVEICADNILLYDTKTI